MDPTVAKRMAKELIGQTIDGWLIKEHRGDGKSALVFEAEKDGGSYAVKVFDPDLIQRYGKKAQLERIRRECSLIGKHHPNLVRIYGGGECTDTGHLYVAMELVESQNLADCLDQIPHDNVAHIIQQVAAAARFLEELGLVHRDIKPENISISTDYQKATLLDLGVLRPFGNSELTDDDARPFIGTLRYSSPEFLTRTEEDTIEGWRAVTYYQLGATLHDMIMKQPLFQDFSEPYAVLVDAVNTKQPLIQSIEVHPDLVVLAQNCLLKRPQARLDLISWDDFNLSSDGQSAVESARARVCKRNQAAQSHTKTSGKSEQAIYKRLSNRIATMIDSIIRDECTGESAFPRMEIRKCFNDQPHVEVIYDSSPHTGLLRQLLVRVYWSVVDVSSKSVQISVSACLLPSYECECLPPTSTIIYGGPIDSPTMTQEIKGVLWCAVDKAQAQATSAQETDDFYWLDICKQVGEVD